MLILGNDPSNFLPLVKIVNSIQYLPKGLLIKFFASKGMRIGNTKELEQYREEIIQFLAAKGFSTFASYHDALEHFWQHWES
jgi:hypothetical protein